jgi:hypothetical protein
MAGRRWHHFLGTSCLLLHGQSYQSLHVRTQLLVLGPVRGLLSNVRLPCLSGTSKRRSWIDMNPGWQHWVWDETDQRELVAKSFPGLLEFYDAALMGVEHGDIW